MASDLNKVILIGRLTRDPELRYTPNGTAVANFSIANNRTFTSNNEKKEDTSFFNCIAWTKVGELIVQYCKKGNRVGLEGRLQQRTWQDQDGKNRSTVEVVVENIQFLENRSDNQSGTRQESGNQTAPSGSIVIEDNPFSDDDIPF